MRRFSKRILALLVILMLFVPAVSLWRVRVLCEELRASTIYVRTRNVYGLYANLCLVRIHVPQCGSGNGCLISPSGRVLTAYHLLGDDPSRECTVFGESQTGESFEAKYCLEKSWPDRDLAVLRPKTRRGFPQTAYASIAKRFPFPGDSVHMLYHRYLPDTLEKGLGFSKREYVFSFCEETTIITRHDTRTATIPGKFPKGTSGSPCFNAEGDLIGIHKGGYQSYYPDGSFSYMSLSVSLK